MGSVKNIAVLFGNGVSFTKKRPLDSAVMNSAYEDFLLLFRKHHAEAFIAPWLMYKDGVLKKAVTFDGKWKTAKNVKVNAIFDKFPFNPITKKFRKNLKVPIINSPEFEEFCKDKLATYRAFPGIVPKSLLVNCIKDYRKKLNHISTSRVVIKPRYGLGGVGVRIINKSSKPGRIPKNTIIMEFVDSGKGNKSLGAKGTYDIRCVVINGRIEHCLCREARKHYLTNYHQGGRLWFVDKSKVPGNVMDIVRRIDKKVKKFIPRIYTADFMIDPYGKPWLIEMNSKPGLQVTQKLKALKKVRGIQQRFYTHIIKQILKTL